MLECHEVPHLHAKRGYARFETSKSENFCRTRHRHGHTALTRTVADDCERLRTVAQRVAHTASTPKPPVKREPLKQEPLLRIRKKHREQQYQKKNRTARTSKDWRSTREQDARHTVPFYLQYPPRKSKSKCRPKSW